MLLQKDKGPAFLVTKKDLFLNTTRSLNKEE
jgi:hypothetical protein